MWMTILAFLLPLVVYFFTLAPGVTFGDSGELIVAAYSLGISHPPGSPLWTIVAKLFTFLPINSIAWRVNLVSAFFAAATCGVLFIYLRLLGEMWFPKFDRFKISASSLIAVTTLSFGRSFWGQAVISEVYSLNTFLFAWQLFIFTKWLVTKRAKWLLWLALTIGLGLSNHYIFLLLLPVYAAVLALAGGQKIWNLKFILKGVLCLVLGLLFYAYIPIRARQQPTINWGNPGTISRFTDYIQRKSIAVNVLQNDTEVGINVPVLKLTSIADVAIRAKDALIYVIRVYIGEFIIGLLFLMFMGIWVIWKRKNLSWSDVWIKVLLTGVYVIGSWGYAFLVGAKEVTTGAKYPELGFSFIIFAVYIYFGCLAIWEWTRKYKKIILSLGVATSMFFLPIIQVVKFWSINNWSNHTVALEHGKNLLKEIPENSVLVVNKNMWVFPLLYLIHVEKMRPDIEVIDGLGNSVSGSYSPFFEMQPPQLLSINKVKELFPDRQIYVAGDKDIEDRYKDLRALGVVYEVASEAGKIVNFTESYASLLNINHEEWQDEDTRYMLFYYHLRLGDELMRQKKATEAFAEYDKAQVMGQYSAVALTNLSVVYGQKREWPQAINLARKAIKLQPERLLAWKNLGFYLAYSGETEEAIKAFKKVIELHATDADARLVLAELYEKKQNYEQAIEEYEYLLRLNTDRKMIEERIAKLYLTLGKCEKVISDYSDLMATSPSGYIISNNIGVCLARQGKIEEAIKYWELAIKIRPDYKQAADNLRQAKKGK